MGYEDLGAPQSRNEVLLMNMLGASYEVVEPQSRIEYLLKELLDSGGGSGEVTGVKGALEDTWRKGNVNLTLLNLAEYEGGIRYDELTKVLHGPQYDVIPTAASVWLGKIIQYTGADTTNFKNGRFYKCILVNDVYVWDEVLGTESEPLTEDQVNALLALLN